MRKLMKLCRCALSLALVLAMMLSLCANGLTALAALSEDAESRKDAILKEFFGDGVTTEEAFNKLLAETEKMEDYQNKTYQYVPNKNSYYVALGDEVGRSDKMKNASYVEQLRDLLKLKETAYKNLCQPQNKDHDPVVEVYNVIKNNASDIAKADLITVGFSNFSAAWYMFQSLGNRIPPVTDAQWSELVGKENLPLVQELLDVMFEKVQDQDLSSLGSFDFNAALEWYTFTYMSNAIHQAQIIEEIRKVNQNAVIVLVGTYNDMEGVVLKQGDTVMDLGALMPDLVNAANLLSSKNAEHYRRVAYVHAPDVTTCFEERAATQNMTLQAMLFSVTMGKDGLPSEKVGQVYIAQQIKAALADTCSHTWDEGTVTKEPGCNKKGEMTYQCTWCGETKTETVAATGKHNTATRMENRKAPTCLEDGSYDVVTYCQDCGTVIKTETVPVPATGKHEYTVEKVEATCTEGGRTVYTCKVCGHSYKEETPAIGHLKTHLEGKVEPTCDQAGYTGDKICDVCGEVVEKGQVIPATGHGNTHVEGEVEPTCDQAGYTGDKICDVCGDVVEKGQVIPATGHGKTHVEGEVEAACGKPGYTGDQVCDICGKIVSKGQEIPALEHPFTSAVVDATCMSTGSVTYTCTLCGHSYSEVLPVDPDAHTGVNHVENEKAATCTQAGYSGDTVCECGVVLEQGKTTPVVGHKEVIDAAVAPTCGKTGLTEGKHCQICGQILVAQEVVEALEHDWQFASVKEEHCCYSWINYACSHCGETKTELSSDGNGQHKPKYEDNGDGISHTVICENTGNTLDAAELHQYVEGVCGKCGYEAVCQHQWDAGVLTKPATCNATGHLVHTCTLCQEQYTEYLPVDPNAHTGVNHVENEKDATCTVPGYTGDTVCECGAIVEKGQEIPALGHSYAVTSQTDATCVAAGEKIFTCTVCGHSYVEVLPVAPDAHTGVNHVENEKDATCTVPGYTGDTVCECGVIVEKGQELPATNRHEYGEWEIIQKPTTEETGLRKHTCIHCGHTEEEEMPVLTALLGDVNGDGKLNARDARALLRAIAGLDGDVELDPAIADFNGDGKINARDARALLRKIAGLGD